MRDLIAASLFLASISCSKDDKDPSPVQPTLPEVASCKVLHSAGISPFFDSTSDAPHTPVVACFESPSQLTVDWCENAGPGFDTEKRVYELFKGETRCPTSNVVGKCVYPKSNDRREEVTVWYYSSDQLTTDFDLVRRGCNYEGMYFSLI